MSSKANSPENTEIDAKLQCECFDQLSDCGATIRSQKIHCNFVVMLATFLLSKRNLYSVAAAAWTASYMYRQGYHCDPRYWVMTVAWRSQHCRLRFYPPHLHAIAPLLLPNTCQYWRYKLKVVQYWTGTLSNNEYHHKILITINHNALLQQLLKLKRNRRRLVSTHIIIIASSAKVISITPSTPHTCISFQQLCCPRPPPDV